MSRLIKEIIVAIVVILVLGLLYLHQHYHQQDVLTRTQMRNVQAWSVNIEKRFNGIDNNMNLIYNRMTGTAAPKPAVKPKTVVSGTSADIDASAGEIKEVSPSEETGEVGQNEDNADV